MQPLKKGPEIAHQGVAAAISAANDDTLAPAQRFAACERLIADGFAAAALPALRRLAEDPTWSGRARVLLRTGEFMFRSGLANGFAQPDELSRASGAVLWRNSDPEQAARSLVIVFSGRAKRFWVSIDLLHRLLRTRAGQVLYLRDDRNSFYLKGATGLGTDFQSALAELRRRISEAGAKKVCVLGTSSGGYAALRYGAALGGVHGTLVFSPATELDSTFAKLSVSDNVARHVEDLRHLPGLDVVPIYESASPRPRTRLVYAGLHQEDAAQAERLAHLPEVQLISIAGLDCHDTIAYLLANGEFTRLLDDLIVQ